MCNNSLEYWESVMAQADKEVYDQDEFQGQEVTSKEWAKLVKEWNELKRKKEQVEAEPVDWESAVLDSRLDDEYLPY
ncbi:MAG: hypothetical protein WC390_08480 [Sulfurimonas sp.]|jgi:hypothetical protein